MKSFGDELSSLADFFGPYTKQTGGAKSLYLPDTRAEQSRERESGIV